MIPGPFDSSTFHAIVAPVEPDDRHRPIPERRATRPSHRRSVGKGGASRPRRLREQCSDALWTALEASPDAMLVTDDAGRIVAWNAAMEDRTGLPAHDVLGKARAALASVLRLDGQPTTTDLPGDECEPDLDLHAQHHSAARSRRLAVTLLDGPAGCVDTTEVQLRDRSGRAVGVLEIIRDVTPTRRAEDQLVQLESTVEQSPDAILVTDAHRRIVYVNAAFERLTGYARREAAGRDAVDLLSVPEALPASFRSTLGSARPWAGELPIRTSDGTLLDVDWTVTPFVDPVREPTGYVGTARDRSRERALEVRLAEANKMEAVGRLAGGIAHDFNNLVLAIRGYTELVASDLAEADPRRADLEQVIRAADRAAALTRQLLAFSRRQVLLPRIIDPAATVQEIAPLVRRLVGEDVDVDVVAAPGLWHISADPGQLEQVIVNLAVNARDAMPAGGRIRIELRNAPIEHAETLDRPGLAAGEYVALVVSDTGTGMDAGTLAHIFEPFFTTKAPGQGTGLGLASVYGIVKQSGGYVYARSAPGNGSTFTIYLPRAHGNAAAVADGRPIAIPPRGSGTLLVAEDDEAVRELLRRVLERLGYEVLVARDGGHALDIAADPARRIDLLITDVVMPGQRGPALATQLQNDRPDLRVLLVSGHPHDDPSIGDIGGPVPYLSKPFGAAELARHVRAALGEPGDQNQPTGTDREE